jgi:hypothetical protein
LYESINTRIVVTRTINMANAFLSLSLILLTRGVKKAPIKGIATIKAGE